MSQADFNNPISFSWDLHYVCNYRCPYCWWDGKWQELAKLNRYLSVKEWMKYWGNIYSRYGSVTIEILGGEPFIYPNFSELINELSGMHNIGITTNLSTDIEYFIRQIDPSKVKASPTFHPLFADFDSFVEKALLLKENGFTENINYLAYPPQIKQISYYKERFNQKGLSISVMTFWGEYRGVTYPEGYTEKEREIIGAHLGKRADEEFQLTPKKMPKARLCRAGQRYAVIQADGNVIRCGGSDLNETIGNFFDENFKLLEKPMPCKAEYCKCNEWAFLLEKMDDRIIAPPDFRKDLEPYHVFFTWEITHKCNYQCSYCSLLLEKGLGNEPDTVYLSPEEWFIIWKRVYDKYGSCEIHLTGGEPFIYPHFMEIVSKLIKLHTFECSTNLFWEVDNFIENIPPDRARLGVSFHPEIVDYDKFLKKAVRLKRAGFEVWINYVAYPPVMEDIETCKKLVQQEGIRMSILPFNGEYNGKKYPNEYTKEEKEFLNKMGADSIEVKKAMDWAFKKDKEGEKRTKICRMGQMYARIRPDGLVDRCCGDNAKKLGNLIDNTFSLLDEPLPCESKDCRCWRSMVVGEEERWVPHWVVPPAARNLR